MKSLNLLIVLVHSSKNIGDRAILESTVTRFRKVLHDPRIVVLANYPDEAYFKSVDYQVEPSPWVLVGKTYDRPTVYQIASFLIGIGWALLTRLSLLFTEGIPVFVPQKWRNLFQGFLDADLVIGSGGNQFYASGKYGWPFPLNAMSVWLAHLFKKPFYGMPQSIGPLKRKWEINLLTSLYRDNKITFLRDRKSMRLAEEIGLHNVNYAPDLAFSPNDVKVGEAIRELKKFGFNENKHNVGMTVIGPMGRALDRGQVDLYYEIIALTIEHMMETFECDVYIFRQVSGPSKLEDDGLANVHVCNKINPSFATQLHLINEEFPPSVLMSLYQPMDLFIASRLHSGIFSLCSKVPTVFIGYLSKTLGVLESLGLETWGVELSNLEPKKLWNLIHSAWEQKDHLHKQIEEMLPLIFKQTEEVINYVVDDCGKYLE